MTRIIFTLFLFLGISVNTFAQPTKSEIRQLVKVINSDSLIKLILNRATGESIRNAKMQIQGAGAAEKFDTYSKFILAQKDKMLNSFYLTEIPAVYKKRFTLDEINEIKQVYQSPAGQGLLAELSVMATVFKNEKRDNITAYKLKLDSEDLKYFKAFSSTATGQKLFEQIGSINNELEKTLQINYIPEYKLRNKKELARLDSKIWEGAYKVKPEQIIVYDGEFSNNNKVVNIKNDCTNNETYVTFAVPIHENKFWIRFDKNTSLVDEKSGEHYLATRLENGFVLNKTMIVFDQKKKMIEVTMAFPLLKKSVKRFRIEQSTSDDADLMSNNTAHLGINTLVKLKVKKYKTKKDVTVDCY